MLSDIVRIPVSCVHSKMKQHSLIPPQCAHEKLHKSLLPFALAFSAKRDEKLLQFLFKANWLSENMIMFFLSCITDPMLHWIMGKVFAPFSHQLALHRCTFFHPFNVIVACYLKHFSATVALGVQDLITCTHLALNARSESNNLAINMHNHLFISEVKQRKCNYVRITLNLRDAPKGC